MKKTIEHKAIKQLRIHYDIHVTVLVALFLLVLLRVVDFQNAFTVGIVAERYALMITIIAIPAALRIFTDRLKKIPKNLSGEEAVNRYKNIYYLRLYMIGIVTLGNILLFAMSRNSNFMWLTIVLFVVYFFCRPSYPELVSLTETKNSQENDEQTA